MSATEHLQARITELQTKNYAATLHYAGLQNLFNAAAVIPNTQDMDELRERMHASLDEQLDNNAALFMLTKQLIAMGGGK